MRSRSAWRTVAPEAVPRAGWGPPAAARTGQLSGSSTENRSTAARRSQVEYGSPAAICGSAIKRWARWLNTEVKEGSRPTCAMHRGPSLGSFKTSTAESAPMSAGNMCTAAAPTADSSRWRSISRLARTDLFQLRFALRLFKGQADPVSHGRQ